MWAVRTVCVGNSTCCVSYDNRILSILKTTTQVVAQFLTEP